MSKPGIKTFIKKFHTDKLHGTVEIPDLAWTELWTDITYHRRWKRSAGFSQYSTCQWTPFNIPFIS